MFKPKASLFFTQSLLISTALAAIIGTTACNFKYDKVDGRNGGLREAQMNTAGYAEINAAIFKPKCIGCHSKQEPVLTSYEAIVANIGDIADSVLEKHSMPKRGPLSEDLQAMLRSWIAAGTPKDTPVTNPTTGVSGIQRPYNFTSLQKDVFEGRCVNCHSTGNEHGLTPLDTYKDVLSVQDFLQPVIFGVIDGQPVPPEDQMPPPKVSGPLTYEEKALVLIWFADGMRDENGIPAPLPSPSPIPNPIPSPVPSPIPSPAPSTGASL
jgi:uncharacterized membrane protein